MCVGGFKCSRVKSSFQFLSFVSVAPVGTFRLKTGASVSCSNQSRAAGLPDATSHKKSAVQGRAAVVVTEERKWKTFRLS